MTLPRSALNGALLLACALAGQSAWAQPAPSAAASAAERAQKETDRTMYWIRVLASKPAPAKTATAPRPAAAVAVASAKPATETREKVKVAAGTSTATAPANATAMVAAQAPNATPAPFGDLPEPSALSSSNADNVAAAVPTAAAPALPDTPPPADADTVPDPGLVQIASVQPDFPSAIVQLVHKGNVEVKFEVEPGGTVVAASVVESSHPRLNAPALRAIKQWRFKPTPKSHTALVNLVFDVDAEG